MAVGQLEPWYNGSTCTDDSVDIGCGTVDHAHSYLTVSEKYPIPFPYIAGLGVCNIVEATGRVALA